MSVETISKTIQLRGDTIHYQVCGKGTPLLFVHGWPLHGETFRPLLPYLSKKYKCYLVDLPGMGKSSFHKETDFRFEGHAAMLQEFCDKVIKEKYFCIGQDTGATTSRVLATNDNRMKKLILLNTEMPGHHPPWVQTYQLLFRLPGTPLSMRFLMKQNWYLKSPMGFRGCFEDLSLINETFLNNFVSPILTSDDRIRGVMRYLIAVDFKTVDRLPEIHSKIKIPVCLLWGENDPTFPVAEARVMLATFNPGTAQIKVVPKTKLLLHMEKPAEVARLAIEFLK